MISDQCSVNNEKELAAVRVTMAEKLKEIQR
ncbi:hypothetical protein J3R75_000684 [Oligosphaera ethanolica]|uniref:Uncharacterized protein n=1 Tax=Oligosphaera ethanolica TaxID=760260 RepID=A0AAE3VDL6_9BACT|nr:hypothetical protein [Oligosphaera ethanolica]